jgi:hypothetical protein
MIPIAIKDPIESKILGVGMAREGYVGAGIMVVVDVLVVAVEEVVVFIASNADN